MTRELFVQFAEKLRSFGYRVYLNKNAADGNFAVFTDGKRVAAMRQAKFDQQGINFGTIHKPCREYGRGFAIQGTYDALTLDAVTGKKAEEAFASVPENWPHTIKGSVIKKYADFEDWKAHDLYADLYDYGE